MSIYKIISTESTEVYIGSTSKSLKLRMQMHKSKYNAWNNNNTTGYCSSFKLFHNHGFLTCSIVILEENIDKCDLKKQERKHIEACTCVNIRIPTRLALENYYAKRDIINQKQYCPDCNVSVCKREFKRHTKSKRHCKILLI